MHSCRGRNESLEKTKSPPRLRCDLVSMGKTGSQCSGRGENCESFGVPGGETQSRENTPPGGEMRDGVNRDYQAGEICVRTAGKRSKRRRRNAPHLKRFPLWEGRGVFGVRVNLSTHGFNLLCKMDGCLYRFLM